MGIEIAVRPASSQGQVRPADPPHEPPPNEGVDAAEDFLSHGPAFRSGFGRVPFGHVVYQRPCADGFRLIAEHRQNVPVNLVLRFRSDGFGGWENWQRRSRLKTWIN
jgi:hypothetical protein